MAAITTIALLDGLATPVSHDFVPYQPQQGTTAPAIWYNKEASTPLGWRKITLSVKFQAKGVSKVRVVISDPILAVIAAGCCIDTNTPQVSYTDLLDMTFSVPYQATVANRKDILAFAKNLLSNSAVVNAVVNLETVF